MKNEITIIHMPKRSGKTLFAEKWKDMMESQRGVKFKMVDEAEIVLEERREKKGEDHGKD